jgi:dipeptidyl aminopeptidase/acylaminoacyl peptidase
MPAQRGAKPSRRPAARGKPPLTVDALWAIRRLGVPTLSPDGALACAAVTRFDMEKNDSSTELWLYPTGLADAAPGRAAGRIRARRLTAGDKDGDPKWSPDGRAIAFTAKRKDDEEPQVYVIAPDGGEARRLTSLAHGCSALRWFGDGRRIAFVSWVWPDLATNALQARRRKERKEATRWPARASRCRRGTRRRTISTSPPTAARSR